MERPMPQVLVSGVITIHKGASLFSRRSCFKRPVLSFAPLLPLFGYPRRISICASKAGKLLCRGASEPSVFFKVHLTIHTTSLFFLLS